MKYIFVSIEEFLANGGILEKDREIYTNKQRHFTERHPIEFYTIGYYLVSNNAGNILLAYNATYKSFPLSLVVHYVKIEVTPIWK